MFSDTLGLLGNITQFVGYVAFIRGWILLLRIGEQGSQPGAFAKAVTHIVGGLVAINIFGTVAVIQNTIGW